MNPFQNPAAPQTNKQFHDLLVSNRLVEMREFLQNPPEGFDINGPVKASELTNGLQYAILNMFYPMVDLLLEFEADPNKPDKHGQTAFHAATTDGATEVIPSLLLHGGRVDVKTHDGQTPFSAADLQPELLTMLLNVGAHPDEANERGFSNLHGAAIYDYYRAAKVLLDAGADVALANKENKTPFYYANTNYPHCETKKLLEEYLALPRVEEGRSYSLSELLAGEEGKRLVDNPYNWRHGLGENLLRLVEQGDVISKEEWCKPVDAMQGKSLSDIALEARQGKTFFQLLAKQGEPIDKEDIFSKEEGKLNGFGQTIAKYGQMPILFEAEHAGHLSSRVLRVVFEVMPEESKAQVNMHSAIARLRHQQRTQSAVAARGG